MTTTETINAAEKFGKFATTADRANGVAEIMAAHARGIAFVRLEWDPMTGAHELASLHTPAPAAELAADADALHTVRRFDSARAAAIALHQIAS